MKKIIIYTPYDCLIKTKNEETFLETNSHLMIENDIEQPISIYPAGKNSKYSFNIDIINNTSNFYSIIEKDDKILVFLLEGLIAENVSINNFYYNSKKCSIEIYSQNLVFTTETNKKIITLPFYSENFSCGQFSYILYVKFTDLQNEKIVAYNTFTNKAKVFQGDKIILDKDGFTVFNEKSKTLQQSKSEYFVDKEGLKIKSKTTSKNERLLPNELISYNFMENIKNDNYKNALTYLTDDLKNNLNEKSLKEYFGNISYFYPIDKNTCFAISDNINILYEFSFFENKIKEITDFK